MLGEKLGRITDATGKIATNISDKTKDIVDKSKDTVMTSIDANGDGKVDIEDIIILGLKTPGISVDRSEFLSKELMKNHPKEVINKAIATTPANAGIPAEDINLIADNVIKFERTCVTGISAGPGSTGRCRNGCYNPGGYCSILWMYVESRTKINVLIRFPRNRYKCQGRKV